jgi:hypothetical protein
MDFLWYVLWYGLWYPLRYNKNHVLKWLLSSNQATLQGHTLGELGDSIPTQGWLTDAVIDPELRGPVIKARAELHDCSEGHVWVLWDLLEHVLTKGEQALAGKLPTYVPTPRLIRDPKTGLNVLAEAPVPTLDRVTLLLQLIDQQHPSVITLIRAVHDRPEIALAQLLAVLLLHEWAASRPQGALHAAWALDYLYPALRPLIEEAYKTVKSRKTGSERGVEKRKKSANALHARMVQRAEELRADGHDDHELSSRIGEEMDRKPHTVRRVLQKHGILSKRKRT